MVLLRVKGRWYWLSLAAFALAMLGKGSAAVLAGGSFGDYLVAASLKLAGLGADGPVSRDSGRVGVGKRVVPNAGRKRSFPFGRFYRAPVGGGCVPWFYLYEAMFPIDLYFVYPMWQIQPDSFLWWLPLAAALAVTAILWRYRKGWGRALLFAWGFFCVALLPVAGFADVGFMRFSLVADRYQHIAIIGVIRCFRRAGAFGNGGAVAGVDGLPASAAILAAGCTRVSDLAAERNLQG